MSRLGQCVIDGKVHTIPRFYAEAIVKLTDELAECKRDAERDAERYRWLRGTVPESSSRWARWRLEYWTSGAWHELRGLHLDTCIDAALAAEGEK